MRASITHRPDGAAGARSRAWLVALLVFAVVAAVRAWYVGTFAVSLPYWDQWDSEGDLLLRPWIEGNFHVHQLWQAHNEHRIMMSRLLTLGFFELTGEWDNLLSARFNTLLSALYGAALVWLLARTGELRGPRWAILPVLLAGLVLPFGWENFLVGFQSQFYLVSLFALASVMLASHRPDDAWAQWLMLGIAVACCFTLASGILAAVSSAVVLWFHGGTSRSRSMRRTAVMVLLVSIALIGYGTTPRLEHHAHLKAAGLPEWLDALSHLLGWPVSGYHWAAPLLWMPGAIAVVWILLRREASRADLLMLGLLCWSSLQACAAAYSRGQAMIDPASRYLDLLVPGLVANAWFAARIVERARGSTVALPPALAVAAIFTATFIGGHVERFQHDWSSMASRHAQGIEQTRNVARYVATGDPSALDKPYLQIPYPDHNRLRSLLDNASLRDALLRGDALVDPQTGQRVLAAPGDAPVAGPAQ